MVLLAVGVLANVFANIVWAQNQTGRRNRGNNAAADKTPTVKLPEDPRLLELHKALVRDAEKLALEYQKSKQLDKARVVYGEIIRFVPTYGKAANALQQIHGTEATAERKVFEVAANKGWQDTGIDVVEGRPMVFRVFEGKWHLLMDYPVGPDGIEIPKELRQFNLGSLIGIITPPGHKPGEEPQAAPPSADASGTAPAENAPAAEAAPPAEGEPANKDSASSESASQEKKEEAQGPKPFLIGSKLDLLAPLSGRLYVRMYDAQPDDNTGKLKVTITGTFAPPPTYSGSKEGSTLGQK